MASKPRKSRRGFGSIRELPSGRHQATYTGPDLARHVAPRTFATQMDAEGWLTDEYRLISTGTWTSLAARKRARELKEASKMPTFGDYAERWIDRRRSKQGAPLADRTKDAYRDYLRRFLGPTFGHLRLDEITPAMVNDWHDDLLPRRDGRGDTGEHQRAKIYTFARAVMTTAVSAHGTMPGAVNPFAIRGGGSAVSKRRDEHVVNGAELTAMVEHMRDDRALMLLLAAYCGLRFSEIAALRRTDIDVKERKVKVRRAVSRSREGGVRDKAPKSAAGVRDNLIPSHVMHAVKAHLGNIVTGRDGLLFPGHDGGYLAPSAFYGKATGNGWYGARRAAGRGDLHFHDLRATGATLLARNGATEAEVQRWLGDSTAQAAQRYVRATTGRMVELAERMPKLSEF